MSRSPPQRRRSPSPKDGGRGRSRSPPGGDRGGDRDDGCKSLLVRNIPTDVRPQELKVMFLFLEACFSFCHFGPHPLCRICSPSSETYATFIAPTTITPRHRSASHLSNTSTVLMRPRPERNSMAPLNLASPCRFRRRNMVARIGMTCAHGMTLYKTSYFGIAVIFVPDLLCVACNPFSLSAVVIADGKLSASHLFFMYFL